MTAEELSRLAANAARFEAKIAEVRRYHLRQAHGWLAEAKRWRGRDMAVHCSLLGAAAYFRRLIMHPLGAP